MVITFPTKSSYEAKQFFKTQLGVKLGGLSSLLDAAMKLAALFTVLSESPGINLSLCSSAIQRGRQSICCDLQKTVCHT